MDKIAVVPGSFDPVTIGHVDIIRRAARLFDRVYVVVMENTFKQHLLACETRLELLREALQGIENVTAEYSAGYLVDYAREKGACALVKGARCGEDFEYEMSMAVYNRERYPQADTLVLCAGEGLMQVSSSFVREKIKNGESVSGLVTPACERAVCQALAGLEAQK